MEYIAGGATQNSIRVAQWMLQVGGGQRRWAAGHGWALGAGVPRLHKACCTQFAAQGVVHSPGPAAGPQALARGSSVRRPERRSATRPSPLPCFPRTTQVPGATSYFGCVGSDHYAEELRKVAAQDGVNVRPLCRFLGALAAAF